MKYECKHGLPVSWDFGRAEWREDQTLRQTVTVTMCRTCVDEGAAKALALELECMIRRAHAPPREFPIVLTTGKW
jgi:hypothetical protein